MNKVTITLSEDQCQMLIDALGLALEKQPPNQRVAIAANAYAPIVQALQSGTPVDEPEPQTEAEYP